MKKNHLIHCCIFFIFISSIVAQKESIRFEKISIDQGLSQNSVIAICRDSKGFMWFGTYDGLNRYDGYNFKVFRNNSEDNKSLVQNSIRSIYEDHLGNLWIGTEDGLSKLNRNEENFINYINNPADPGSISSNRIRDIYEDKNENLWITTENGLNRYDRSRNIFIKYFHNPNDNNSIISNYIRTIYEDSRGNLWVGTNAGLELFDLAAGKFNHFIHDPQNPFSISGNFISSIIEDKFGTLWIGTKSNGINRLDRGGKKFIHYKFNPGSPGSLRHNTIRGILEDKDSNLWIGTYGGGIEKYNRKLDKFIHYQKDFNDPNSISSNAIHCIYEDKYGVIWIGTDFGGINKFDKSKNQFLYFGNNSSNPKSLTNNNILSFYEDPDDNGKTIWIGTWGGGLGLFDRINSRFTFYKNIPGNANSLTNDVVRSITKDKSGILWIGTDGGLTSFDKKTNKFKQYTFDPNNPYSIGNDLIKTVYVDNEGELWIGTNGGGGLGRYDKINDRFINYLPDPKNPGSINDDIIWSLHEDEDGRIWICTNSGGLNCFNKKNEKFTHFIKDPNNPKSISENKVLTICEDEDGIIWLGTAGGGLNKFDKWNNSFTVFTAQDGLVSNTVHAIVESDDKNLWISTPHGISKFNPQKNEFVNYNIRDGLQSDEFHVNSFCKSINGEIFLGGINGFNIFKPENIKPNNFIFPLVLEDLQLYNKSVPIGKNKNNRVILQKSISETKKITLSYSDEVFSLEFALLNFTSPEKNLYAYKMEGFEQDWNYVGSRNYATYTNLPPGQYVFKVKGSCNGGIWNKTGLSLEINIIPPFWKTWWFKVFATFLMFGALFATYQMQTSRIRRYKKELELRVLERKMQLQEANKELEAFSYSVSHDLRAPLRAINGYTNIFLEEYGDKVDDEGKRLMNVITGNTKKMGNLVSDLLAFSRIGSTELKMQFVDINSLVGSVINEFLENSSNRKIEIYTAQLPGIICDQLLIRNVWFNLISNAIKFSSKTETPKIEIGFEENENEIIYFIKDNGVGFNQQYEPKLFGMFQRLIKEEDFEGTGVGLAVVQRIIQKHNGTVWAKGELDKGASFYFNLPKKEV